MKKIFFCCLFITFLNRSYAQSSWGVHGGFTFSSLYQKNADFDVPSAAKLGVQIGGSVNQRLSRLFSLRTELNFIEKGGRYKNGYNLFGTIIKPGYQQLSYLQLAPALTVFDVDDGITMFFGAGPELSLGLGGKDASNIVITNGVATVRNQTAKKIVFDGKANSADGKTHYKRTDYGINFIVGLKTKKGFEVSGGYIVGVNNIYPDKSFVTKNRLVSVKFGYRFP